MDEALISESDGNENTEGMFQIFEVVGIKPIGSSVNVEHFEPNINNIRAASAVEEERKNENISKNDTAQETIESEDSTDLLSEETEEIIIEVNTNCDEPLKFLVQGDVKNLIHGNVQKKDDIADPKHKLLPKEMTADEAGNKYSTYLQSVETEAPENPEGTRYYLSGRKDTSARDLPHFEKIKDSHNYGQTDGVYVNENMNGFKSSAYYIDGYNKSNQYHHLKCLKSNYNELDNDSDNEHLDQIIKCQHQSDIEQTDRSYFIKEQHVDGYDHVPQAAEIYAEAEISEELSECSQESDDVYEAPHVLYGYEDERYNIEDKDSQESGYGDRGENFAANVEKADGKSKKINYCTPTVYKFQAIDGRFGNIQEKKSKYSPLSYASQTDGRSIFEENIHNFKELKQDEENNKFTNIIEGKQIEEIERFKSPKKRFLQEEFVKLQEGTHPYFNKHLRALRRQYQQRLMLNEINRRFMIDLINKSHQEELETIDKCIEEEKRVLKESLITSLEEEKQLLESERNLKISDDPSKIRLASYYRKLPKRNNEPMTNVEKIWKIKFLLDEKDVEEDLKVIYENWPSESEESSSSEESSFTSSDTGFEEEYY